jgi:proteasome lid subunit RPN8/RPN11
MDLPTDLLHEILLSAEKEYPRECCGFILRSKRTDATGLRHIRIRNAQDDFHAQDPVRFPRTSRNAYAMDSAQLLRVSKDLREKNEEIYVIYHSHPDQDAFFSSEDQRLALDDQDVPIYDTALYLVVSVKLGKMADWKLFHWDHDELEFKE